MLLSGQRLPAQLAVRIPRMREDDGRRRGSRRRKRRHKSLYIVMWSGSIYDAGVCLQGAPQWPADRCL